MNKIIPQIIKLLTFYFNFFNKTLVYNKLKKNPTIEPICLKAIRGIQKKEMLSPPRRGWKTLESSLKSHGYDPEKFNYIELNKNHHIIDGDCPYLILSIETHYMK